MTTEITPHEDMSPTIGKLAEALSKAQGEITGALKDSTNPFFKSSYADLASVLAAGREALTNHDLAVIQTTEPSEIGIVVVTTLAHKSGEWMRGKLRMTPVKNDPQGIGSCITYARRYALSAIIGIAQVDDDGEAATRTTGARGMPSEGPMKKALSNEEMSSLLDVVTEARRIVDEYDDNLEEGARLARELYEPLPNDARMFVNGELGKAKFKAQSGRQKAYWSAFAEYLKAAG